MNYRSLAVAALAATSLFAADYAAEGRLWWAHVQSLANDRMQGRNTGSPEFLEAAKYVEEQFERIGLKPAGTSGYRQPVRFESRTLTDPSIELLRDGKTEAVTVGVEATLGSRAEMPAVVEAPLVFTGYGMSIPEAHYDDLAGLDLHGKIAVYVNAAAPVDASENVKSHFSSAGERWAVFRKAGAIGMAALPDPRPNAPRATGAGGRGESVTPPPSVVLADRELQERPGSGFRSRSHRVERRNSSQAAGIRSRRSKGWRMTISGCRASCCRPRFGPRLRCTGKRWKRRTLWACCQARTRS